MWSKLEEILTETGYPYFRQGSFQDGDSMPESMFTFWNADTPEDGYYDDRAHKAIWVWYVYFYTRDPALIYGVCDAFVESAKRKGFILAGKAHDIPADEPDYFGRYVELKWIENYD